MKPILFALVISFCGCHLVSAQNLPEIEQIGTEHHASIGQHGDLASANEAFVHQSGQGNGADVLQTAAEARNSLIIQQAGSGNQADAEQLGYFGATADLQIHQTG